MLVLWTIFAWAAYLRRHILKAGLSIMARITPSVTRRRLETFPWNKLPGEIRLIIYGLIVPQNEIDTRYWALSLSEELDLNQREEAVAILHLNKAIRAEALEEIWP